MTGVVHQNFVHNSGHLLSQQVSLEVDEDSGCHLGDEDEEETGEVQSKKASDLINGTDAAQETHDHGQRSNPNQDVGANFQGCGGLVQNHDETLIIQHDP